MFSIGALRVHWQTFKTIADCRKSNRRWGQLLPERKLSVYIDKPGIHNTRGLLNLTLTFDEGTLNPAQNGEPFRSNFILTMEGSDDGVIWQPIISQARDSKGQPVLRRMHPLHTTELLERYAGSGLNAATIELRFESGADEKSFCRYRARLVEVEWFSDLPPNAFDPNIDILDDDCFRVRYNAILE